jgi:hypothetical protein
MTPKEKAQNLIDEFLNADYTDINYDGAIQCALIAVDEILQLCWNGNLKAQQYWQEVKQEICDL